MGLIKEGKKIANEVRDRKNKKKIEKEKLKIKEQERAKERKELEKQRLEDEEKRLYELDDKGIQVELIKAVRGHYSQYEELVKKTMDIDDEIAKMKARITYLEALTIASASDNDEEYEYEYEEEYEEE